MADTSLLLIGLGVFGVLGVGRIVRSHLLRQLGVPLVFVAIAALARWGVPMAGAGGAWGEWTSVAMLLALGYLVVRLVVLAVFEWLISHRFGVHMPRLARDVVALLAYLLVAAAILHSALGIDVKALLGTGAIVTVVVGFALQETLGTLLAGLSLAWEQRLETGSWVEIDGVVGEILELGWRSLLLRTRLGERVLIPNSIVARARMKLLGAGSDAVAIPLRLGVSYAAPPHRVKRTLLRMANDLPLVATDRPPEVRVHEFGDNAITYECRLWTREPWRTSDMADDFYSRAYAALGRAGMEIPFPQRTVRMAAEPVRKDVTAQCQQALGRCPLFAGLPGDALKALASTARFLAFAPGEAVVREGEASSALYVIHHGEVMVLHGGQAVARVAAGEVFGEMAFLSGAPRTATVRAAGSLTVVEVDSHSLGALLGAHAELAEELANRMAARQRELEVREHRAEAASTHRGLAAMLRERLMRLVGG
jgi:small-conductance mechanosensitive channel/CRP-like cAMP-binding protein